MNRYIRMQFTSRLFRFLRRNLGKIIIVAIIVYFLMKIFDSGEFTVDSILENQDITEDVSQTNAINKDFSVHYIDVGQGDSTLITCDGKAMLIDAGDNEHGQTVVDYLKINNINKLDVVVGTHPDADHIGGLDDVIEQIECDKIYLSQKESDSKTFSDLMSAIEKTKHTYQTLKVNDTFKIGNAKISVVGPVKEYEDNNNNSIALLLEYSERRFLFMGDTETEGETDICNANIDIRADVLKCGHHGSSTSSTRNFVQRVNPQYVVISCGTNNKYEHPHNETLQLFREYGLHMFRTDIQGTIILSVSNNQITSKQSFCENWCDGSGKEAILYTGEYVLNVKSKKFHLPTCKNAEDISEKNRQISDKTKGELLDEGYTPCQVCNP